MADVVVINQQAPQVIVVPDLDPAQIVLGDAPIVNVETGGSPEDVSYIAGEDVTGGRLVYVKPDGKVYLFDAGNELLYGLKTGFTLMSKLAGQVVKVRHAGSIYKEAWGLEPGVMHFAGTAGAISTAPSKLVLPVGVTISVNAILIHFGTSYIRRT